MALLILFGQVDRLDGIDEADLKIKKHQCI